MQRESKDTGQLNMMLINARRCDMEMRTQVIKLYGRNYIYDTARHSQSFISNLISDLNKHEWKDKKDKEFAINLVARAIR